jgi:hypothetical protein
MKQPSGLYCVETDPKALCITNVVDSIADMLLEARRPVCRRMTLLLSSGFHYKYYF